MDRTNPATGEELDPVETTRRGRHRGGPRRGRRGLRVVAGGADHERQQLMAERRRGAPGEQQDDYAEDDGPRDGQTRRAGRRRGGEVRVGLRPLRRTRRRVPPGRATSAANPDAESFVSYEPLGAGAGGDAVELPALAGVPLRRAPPHRRQRRHPQTRFERPRVRRGHRGGVRRGGLPRGRLPESHRRLGHRRRGHSGRPHRRLPR